MGRALYPQAAGQHGAAFLDWLAGFGRALRGERTLITTHDAAQALGRAAAEKRRRAELTQSERYANKHAQLRAERDGEGGWPLKFQ